MNLKSVLLIFIKLISANEEFCPKQCDCDMHDDLKRAVCENQNIISIDIGVPKYVQVYNLRENVISELDNFCFKDIGYTYLQFINLSYNRIFWLGLHAFAGLDDLIHLDLSNNRLRSLAADTFWSNPLLEYLDLSGNVFESLRNEPFIMHNSLKVLNLNNCRVTAAPIRMFSRLPNLRKLDISDNYMIGLQIPTLIPMKRLERVELHNEYWKCIPEFVAVEAWLLNHGIDYTPQCKNKMAKMSEKIIAIQKSEGKDVHIDKVWNITRAVASNATAINSRHNNLTLFEKFDQNFPSIWALVMGFEIGFVLGVIGTYIWLCSFCKCSVMSCSRRVAPLQRRRQMRRRGNELRVNLLWNTALHSTVDTPPSQRRHMELPERHLSRTLQSTSVENAGRSETPPPPYAECRSSWVFSAA